MYTVEEFQKKYIETSRNSNFYAKIEQNNFRKHFAESWKRNSKIQLHGLESFFTVQVNDSQDFFVKIEALNINKKRIPTEYGSQTSLGKWEISFFSTNRG